MTDIFLCPPVAGLDIKTHFKIDKAHGFVTDLWAIGHLMLTADQVSYIVSHSQRELG